ncbi:envelope glycoprotein L [Proboscivirus elephantidbeta4]|uniref:Envelope glycoprotein L n=1 Tax=Elephant endotheliotropic herpesvirus 4 TaxID=548914 RepID=A0A0S1TR08_9BETA|nr:envelope glycoprotein L [Elephant endotheliotropic herpesvirus 4]ALM26028.1 envelope glycoprotein L [Elephant endotheliotropic herpesvirus 4]
MSRLGDYVTIIFIIPMVNLSLFHNKIADVSYDLSDSCLLELSMCLKGHSYVFSQHTYTNAYSNMIRYDYESKTSRVMAPLTNTSHDFILLVYNNTEELRVFLTLRHDSGSAWERNLVGLNREYVPDDDNPHYKACDGKRSIFVCSQNNHHRVCGKDRKVNLLGLNYKNSIFTERVVSITAYRHPFKIVVRVLLTNEATDSYRVASIPFHTPALLDVLFSSIYRRVYRHREGLRILHTFKRFYVQSVDEHFRGPRNRVFEKIWSVYDDSKLDTERL